MAFTQYEKKWNLCEKKNLSTVTEQRQPESHRTNRLLAKLSTAEETAKQTRGWLLKLHSKDETREKRSLN